jgi:quercetin dioxygenase-like cupin family protein
MLRSGEQHVVDRNQRVHYSTAFTVGVFCLPDTAVIPLHNHPDMTGRVDTSALSVVH